jgi:hypothetical protein
MIGPMLAELERTAAEREPDGQAVAVKASLAGSR